MRNVDYAIEYFSVSCLRLKHFRARQILVDAGNGDAAYDIPQVVCMCVCDVDVLCINESSLFLVRQLPPKTAKVVLDGVWKCPRKTTHSCC